MINLFGFITTISTYKLAELLKKLPLLKNLPPILLASFLVILILKIFKIDFQTYNESAKILTYLLFPATVALGAPIYKNINLLKRNKRIMFILLVILFSIHSVKAQVNDNTIEGCVVYTQENTQCKYWNNSKNCFK